MDITFREEFFERSGFRCGVEIQHRERFAADFVPAQRHAGDVHLVLAHERADVADDAGAVAIFDQQKDALRLRLHVAAVDFHDARRGAKEGAGDTDPAAFARGGELDQLGEIAQAALARLGHLQADRFREGRRR